MTLQLDTDHRPDSGSRRAGEETDAGLDRTRPNVSGDLSTIFEAAPMFRRVVLGYDRFQVDTYVQWAEDQLATAERERDHLEVRHLRTCTELDEARELLTHSSGGGELLDVSRQVGSLLAAAADEAEGMRAEASAHRSAAAAEAQQVLELAQQVLEDARAEAARTTAQAVTEARETTARAGRVLEEAQRTRAAAQAAAEARLAGAAETERRAAEQAEAVRQQAAEDAVAARERARAEIVAMLATGRDQRRAADEAAGAARDRLDRAAVVLRAEIEALEHRRAALRAEAGASQGPDPAAGRSARFRDRLRPRAR
ncbi:hypothetical protein [Blastococcus xanthinilyticus]|uniref:DivIVA protein n=1 Tax=Blastococcus xanthinilyticus TaxID=1564164 RepID=A0A5S5CYU4_9ACTN|nr:hypothetical protein [Blastococcus xanthinilyticus]TYP88937.1 hypothetical protein BD833_10393 [Blastococcus xanthinilyticus]